MYDEEKRLSPDISSVHIGIYPKNKRISKTSGLIVLEHMYSGQYFGRSYSASSDEAGCLQVTCSNCIIQLAKNHFVNTPLAATAAASALAGRILVLPNFFFDTREESSSSPCGLEEHCG